MTCNNFTLLRHSALFFVSFSCFLVQTNAQICVTQLGTGTNVATVWLKPENATQSAGTVSGWNNAGYAGALANFSLTSTGAAVTYETSGLNFNPTVRFNGGQFLRVPSVARNTFMPNSSAHTTISVHYSAGGIMIGHQTAANTQKFSHELGGGFIGSSPSWFTFPTPGINALTTILVNGATVFPYGSGQVGTTIGNSPLPDASADLTIGAFRAGEYKMNGHVAEILMYNFALSAAQRNQVESYLAAKYGITLGQAVAQNYTASNGTIYWNAASNGARNARITAIGRDDCIGLNQKQSVSSEAGSMLTIGNGIIFATTNALNTNTFSADRTFLAIGDDNGNVTAWTATGAPTGRTILARKWQVDETNAVGMVRLRVPDNSSTAVVKLPAETQPVVMLVDADGDFTNGSVQRGMTLNGTNWEATYDFADGSFFTFATLEAGFILPVQFTNFNAQVSDNSVNLVWNVDIEEGTKEYQIEKSTDGVHFTSIGRVTATGQKSYQFVDAAPVASAYYRIKSVDKDNSYGLTTTARVDGRKVAAVIKAFLSGGNSLTVQHEAAIQGTSIKVTAIDGKLLSAVNPKAGTQRTTINLPSGNANMYFVRYQKPNGEVKIIKVVR